MFKLFKKDGDATPDVGQEDEYDAEHSEEVEEEVEPREDIVSSVSKEALGVPKIKAVTQGVVPPVGASNVEVERLGARIDSVVEWIKQFYERFAHINENIGQIKAMTIANEKKISASMAEAEKAVDIVREVKPAELRIDYQKIDVKIATLAEKLEFNKSFMTEVIDEVNEIKKKSEIFVGTESLIKLNEDTKKELVRINTLTAKAKTQADKVQEIFVEVRKSFAEMQKIKDIVASSEASYSGLKASIDKMSVSFSDIVKREDYSDFKKEYRNKLATFDVTVADVEDLKESIDAMNSLIETNLSVAKRNEEDIGDIGLNIGKKSVKKVSVYEDQMTEILRVVEVLSEQVSEVRKKVGLKVPIAKPVAKVKPVVKSDSIVKKNVLVKPVKKTKPLASFEEVIPVKPDKKTESLASFEEVIPIKPVKKTKPVVSVKKVTSSTKPIKKVKKKKKLIKKKKG